MAETQHKNLGAAIQAAREAKGLSRPKLAKEIPVDPNTIKRWERGTTAGAMESLGQVAKALGTTEDKLLAAAVDFGRKRNPTSDGGTPDVLGGSSPPLSALRDRMEERFDALQDSIDGLAVQLAAVAAQVDALSHRPGLAPPGAAEGGDSDK